MSNAAAIEALEKRLSDLERKANILVEVINDMRVEDGLPPRPPFGGRGLSSSSPNSTSGGAVTHIGPDTFYGKKLQTALREYLEMRKAQGHGPATPRELYEAITAGGFNFSAATPEIALVGLRALLRKRTAVFHKLPNGTYGLTAWYPHAKPPKTSAASAEGAEAEGAEDDDANDEIEATPSPTPAGAAA